MSVNYSRFSSVWDPGIRVMGTKCSRCSNEAVYEARYSGEYLCSGHFISSFERRVKKEVREQIDFSKEPIRISVAISGGKDSSVTLHVLANLFKGRSNVSLRAFTIDEGIVGYRDSGLENARHLSAELGVPHSVISFSDRFGTTMDRVVDEHPGVIPCSRCGPMRRQLMDTESLELEADYVALGLNLDDYSQSVLMNIARGDAERFLRMAPHRTPVEGLIRRILPLRRIPEKEVMIYAILKNIPFDSSWCPYYAKAQRNTFRSILNELEEKSPGTKFAILNFSDRMKDMVGAKSSVQTMQRCRICGRPSSGEICSVCRGLEIFE